MWTYFPCIFLFLMVAACGGSGGAGETNHAPTASSQSVSGNEDTSCFIVLTGLDQDSDPLTWTFSTPSHGALSGTAPNIWYSPSANYHGTDSFTFRVSDGQEMSNNATVGITINPVNDAPSAQAYSLSIQEDQVSTLSLQATDIDGDPLNWEVVQSPVNGLLGNNTGQIGDTITYTPNGDYHGLDIFIFRVNDGLVDSNFADVSIEVVPVNDAPVSSGQSYSTDEDTLLLVELVSSDIESDVLTYSITGPDHGTLTGIAPDLTYQPDPDYYGSDSFSFYTNDGSDDSNTAQISIHIDGINDPPIAYNLNMPCGEDSYIDISLPASDVENDPLTWYIESNPLHGILRGSLPDVEYLPNSNYYGQDDFAFSVSDGSLPSNVASVRLTVNPGPAIWHVDQSAQGMTDGRSWENAIRHPQDAMDIIDTGDQVWVADGTYLRKSPSDDVVLSIVEDVEVYGGFDGTEITLSQRDFESHPVILDGENQASHVVDMSNADNSILDGFTITRGYAPMFNSIRGGGIYINTPNNIALRINNCRIDDNFSILGGGGSYVSVGPSGYVAFSDSTFSNNSDGEYYGGGLYLQNGNVVIERSRITHNYTHSFGAGIYSSAHLEIYNSLIDSNSALEGGPGEGGGLIVQEETRIVNSTIVNNYSSEPRNGGIGVGTDSLEIINSIVWGNIPDQINTAAYTPIVIYSNLQGGYPGTGNISSNPAFADTIDYRLTVGSPCIDTGTDAGAPPHDIDITPRPLGAGYDMGAYEFIP